MEDHENCVSKQEYLQLQTKIGCLEKKIKELLGSLDPKGNHIRLSVIENDCHHGIFGIDSLGKSYTARKSSRMDPGCGSFRNGPLCTQAVLDIVIDFLFQNNDQQCLEIHLPDPMVFKKCTEDLGRILPPATWSESRSKWWDESNGWEGLWDILPELLDKRASSDKKTFFVLTHFAHTLCGPSAKER